MIENRFKKGLGRGLSSLIGDSSQKIETNKISINDLTRNKFQPRKNFSKESLEELANSIRERGVIQPIIVRPNKSLEGKYEIIANHLRSPAIISYLPSKDLLGLTIIGCMTPCSLMELANSSKLSLLKFFLG